MRFTLVANEKGDISSKWYDKTTWENDEGTCVISMNKPNSFYSATNPSAYITLEIAGKHHSGVYCAADDGVESFVVKELMDLAGIDDGSDWALDFEDRADVLFVALPPKAKLERFHTYRATE